VLQAKHLTTLAHNSRTAAFEPLDVLLLLAESRTEPLTVAGERRYTTARGLVSEPLDKAPFFPRVQVLIGETQDAESVPRPVLLQGIDYISGVVLLIPCELPLADFVFDEEVHGQALPLNSLPTRQGFEDDAAQAHNLDGEWVEESLAVGLELAR